MAPSSSVPVRASRPSAWPKMAAWRQLSRDGDAKKELKEDVPCFDLRLATWALFVWV